MDIGSQITRYRKALAMTQEELGRAVGVSTQAVSRWECGGAPDVALLPAIADTLHVTIDALFGREGGEGFDLKREAARWMAALPEEESLDQLIRLLWEMIRRIHFKGYEAPEVSFLSGSEMLDGDGERVLMRTALQLESGLLLGTFAGDMSFVTICPEPEAGYAAYFSSEEAYRKLFTVLGRPHRLALLLDLYTEKEKFYTVEAAAKRVDLESALTGEILEDLRSVHLVTSVELELNTGTASAYMIHDNNGLVPFLYAARCFMTENDSWHLCWKSNENKPLLRKSGKKPEK